MTNKKPWMMKATSPTQAEIDINGEITTDQWDDADTTSASFRDDLKALGDVDLINLHINSPGGSVFDGISIFNQLKQNKANVNVYIDGLAASIASVIAMSGDTIYMPSNSMLMIHNPWTMAVGNAQELRKQADDLDKVGETAVTTYLERSNGKIDDQQLRQLMDDETWLSAQESVDYGLADEVIKPNQMAASINKDYEDVYKHIPKSLIQNNNQMSDYRQKLIEKSKQENAEIEKQIGGINR